jgi:dTDP-3-amino-2,3,6-trideoxy-4-keto-D-glucose/dTDP-3-amino-3,4,6-trideoxy-alpha-D-glucose/dTDP-2,6-dideoxy-D-kanosamine transaminase
VKVKYSYLDTQFADSEAILESIRGLLKTGQFTLGPAVAEFEQRFATLCGAQFAIGVNSGTDALMLIMKALGIGPGDEVITVPNSFIATAGAIAMVGATPVFVDVADDYNIDPHLIERAITPRTKAILPVHLTGNPAAMPQLMEIAVRRGLHVIEDAAQAIGAAIDGRPMGSWGIAAEFSLHPLKNLNVWGDGGVVVTNSEELAEKVRLLRNHGLQTRDECEFFGHNSRLDTLQAIVACHLLEKLDDVTHTRIRNAQIYDAELASLEGAVIVPLRRENVRQVYHLYVIQARARDRLAAFLEERGIEAKVHYPIPIHLQPAARHLGYSPGDFPMCEAQARSILTLPVHQDLSEGQLMFVVESIREFYASA